MGTTVVSLAIREKHRQRGSGTQLGQQSRDMIVPSFTLCLPVPDAAMKGEAHRQYYPGLPCEEEHGPGGAQQHLLTSQLILWPSMKRRGLASEGILVPFPAPNPSHLLLFNDNVS